MRSLVVALVLATAATLPIVAADTPAPAPAAPTPPAPAAPTPPTAAIGEASSAPTAGGASFVAGGTVGTVADMKAFADEFWNARFDLTKAAKVDHLVLTKDAGKFTLTGWVFRKAPVRGITSRVHFFGEGRFELTPPIDIEKQQVRRFLGTDSIDQPITRCRFDFNGADEQAIFDGLTYTDAAGAEAKAASEQARKWTEETAKRYERGYEPDEEAQRRLGEYRYAVQVYRRLLNPRIEGRLDSDMDVARGAGAKAGSTLAGLAFGYDPDDEEEVGVGGYFDHGDSPATGWNHSEGAHGSQITSFACCGKYAGGMEWAGTSPLLEKQAKERISLPHDTLRMRFDPGGKRDIYMTTTMDLEIHENNLKMIELGITPYLGVTKCWIDGKESDFVQPEIPGQVWLHVPGIGIALPRAYNPGEHVEVKLDLEGKILSTIDGTIWIVKEEDNWFPTPGVGFQPTPTAFDTTLIVPKGFTAVSNGHEAPCEGTIPDGDECVRFVTNTGIDFAAFNIGKEIKITKGTAVDGTPIGIYAPLNLSKTSDGMLQLARLAHATYEDWFGEDPFDRLYLTPHPKSHGRGSASLLLLWDAAFLSATQWNEYYSDIGRPFQPWDMPAFVSHEIAHQWWGGAARIRSSRDQWFSEGFADYGCTIVLENEDIVNGTHWREAKLTEFNKFLTKDDGYCMNLSPLCLGYRIASEENQRGYEGYYQNYIYSKGAFVMHMLREVARAKAGDKIAGDALFKKSIHDFMDWCRGKRPSNYDLYTQMQNSYGMKLDWFFKQWVYGIGIPKVEFSYEIVPAKGRPGAMLRGRVKQKDTQFMFPVEVTVHRKGDKGDAPFFYQWITKADETFEVGPIDPPPEKITINDDDGLLAIVTPVAWEGTAAGQ